MQRIAVISALNLAHELLKLKANAQHYSENTAKRLLHIHNKI